MKKISIRFKAVSLLLVCVMLLSCSTTTAVNAKTPMPFTDIDPNSWYYSGVEYVYSHNYFSGTSDTTFSPNAPMTREMFATVLGAMSGINKNDYPYKDIFKDVKKDKWYTGYVMWAKENNIISGYGDTFGVNDPLTREQLSTILYAYAKYQNIPVEGAKDVEFEKFGDADQTHNWAKTPVSWMSTYELISGTATKNGAPILSPLTNATRAQVAVIIRKYCEANFDDSVKIQSLTLNGNDISEYKIVYGTSYTLKPSKDPCKNAAKKLASVIELLTKKSIEVYSDKDLAKTDKEILIGKTNREDDGTVTIDRSKFEKEECYISMQGNYLVLASDEIYYSSAYSVYIFMEKVLGYYMMGSGLNYATISTKNINVEDGYLYTEVPTMEYRTNLAVDGGATELKGGSYQASFANLVHTLREFSEPDYNTGDACHLKYYLQDDPCLTNEDNIKMIIKNVKVLLNKKYNTNPNQKTLVWLTQTDSSYFCQCETCQKVYRLWGRCATYIQICNFVADAIKDEYPNAYVVGLPYRSTHVILKNNITDNDYNEFLKEYPNKTYIPAKKLNTPDNVILCIALDTSCSSHALDDPNCQNASNNNNKFNREFNIFCSICPTIYTWQYVDSGDYPSLPWPNIYEIYENFRYFNEHNVKGTHVEGPSWDYIDFGALRSYLVGVLSWNSAMSYEEFSNRLNIYLKAYYGTGWTYIREYIDQLEKLSSRNEFHVWYKDKWDYIITEDQYRKNVDNLLGLLEKACSLADTPAYEKNTNRLSLQMRYMKAMVTYLDYQKAQKDNNPNVDLFLAEFEKQSQSFHDFMVEKLGTEPGHWSINTSPYLWEF